jgi:chromosome segregation ATPase
LSAQHQKSWEDNNTIKLAHESLSQKNEQIVQLEKTIRQLNQNLVDSKHEREKTLEAHQSRVKQLQDKFLDDLKIAGSERALESELKLRKELIKDKEVALNNLRVTMEQECHESKKQLMAEIDILQSKMKEFSYQSQEQFEVQLSDRETKLRQFIDDLQKNHELEINALFQKNETLQTELNENMGRQFPGNLHVKEEISRLQNQLNKKENEIVFLKDTVRVECEERMGLVAELSRLQQSVGQASPRVTSRPSSSIKEHTLIEKESLSPKDKNMFKLFQLASQKNGRRLERQSRLCK